MLRLATVPSTCSATACSGTAEPVLSMVHRCVRKGILGIFSAPLLIRFKDSSICCKDMHWLGLVFFFCKACRDFSRENMVDIFADGWEGVPLMSGLYSSDKHLEQFNRCALILVIGHCGCGFESRHRFKK